MGGVFLIQSDASKKEFFGSVTSGIAYEPRKAAYVVIRDGKGRIAAVRTKRGYFLPGGGALAKETSKETAKREVREELARNIRITRKIGEAIQYFSAGKRHYRMQAIFYAAEFISKRTGVGEHRLYWLDRDKLEKVFFHQSHAWAVAQL